MYQHETIWMQSRTQNIVTSAMHCINLKLFQSGQTFAKPRRRWQLLQGVGEQGEQGILAERWAIQTLLALVLH